MLLSACITVQAQFSTIKPDTTVLYAQKDGLDLYMDIYQPSSDGNTYNATEKPTIMFAFGGGFQFGRRNDFSYIEWFKRLTENGYRVVSIDYRLGMKGYTTKGVKMLKQYISSIYLAVEDMYSATEFLIENPICGIDANNIVLSGSSAGAITSLTADYMLCNSKSRSDILPGDFKYAGVMSFAGGVLSMKGSFKYTGGAAPTFLEHGTKDIIVSYKKIGIGDIGVQGSKKIARKMKKQDLNYCIYRYKDKSHEVSGNMNNSFDLQLQFLEKNIMQGKKYIVDATISDPDLKPIPGLGSRKDLKKYGKNQHHNKQ